MAEATGEMGFSPMALPLKGPVPVGDPTKTVISTGTSILVGTLTSPMLSVEKRRYSVSSPIFSCHQVRTRTAASKRGLQNSFRTQPL